MVDEEKAKEVYQIGYNDCMDSKAKLPSTISHNLGPPGSKFSRYAPYDEAYRQGWYAADKDWQRDMKQVLGSLKSAGV